MSAARATIAMMVADTKNTTGLRGSLPGSLPSRVPGRDPPGSRSTEKRSDDGAGREAPGTEPPGADSLSSLDSGDRLTDLLRSSWGLRGGFYGIVAGLGALARGAAPGAGGAADRPSPGMSSGAYNEIMNS